MFDFIRRLFRLNRNSKQSLGDLFADPPKKYFPFSLFKKQNAVKPKYNWKSEDEKWEEENLGGKEFKIIPSGLLKKIKFIMRNLGRSSEHKSSGLSNNGSKKKDSKSEITF